MAAHSVAMENSAQRTYRFIGFISIFLRGKLVSALRGISRIVVQVCTLSKASASLLSRRLERAGSGVQLTWNCYGRKTGLGICSALVTAAIVHAPLCGRLFFPGLSCQRWWRDALCYRSRLPTRYS